MNINRRPTKQISVGGVPIGGSSPITVQSMTNTRTEDVAATVAQIKSLSRSGCDIVRIAVPDRTSAEAVWEIKNKTDIPIVADIHFDHCLALICIERGIDKVRINPGTISGQENVIKVTQAAKSKNIPIRIGVNGGSLEKELLAWYGGATPEAMVESAKRHIDLLNKFGFDDIAVSLKSSSVKATVEAYRLFSQRYDYPLHIGVTESGTNQIGQIKSAIGIGGLLLDGIGDTLRVSLTSAPEDEVAVGRDILRSLGLCKGGVEVISCPTCGRCRIDLIPIAEAVTGAVAGIDKAVKVAVMGCAVNGPGEARDADLGVAGGDGCAVLFRKGEIVRKVPEAQCVDVLMEEIERLKY